MDIHTTRNALLLVTTLALGGQAVAGDHTAAPPLIRFVESSQLGNVRLSEMQQLARGFGQRKVAELLQYDVTRHRLVYETTFKGKAIKASGLMLIPENLKAPAPIISVQHGTTFDKDGVPSSGGFTGMELFAANGFVVLMPDYIGYGESSSVFHPYYDKQHSALAVIDMIKAAKEYLLRKSIPVSDKLFLTGYSEGGYVTLAAAHELETNARHKLTVTAVAAGAGGYDLVDMLGEVAMNTYYSYPSYLAFVLMSYNNTYDWNKPLTYFFRPQYAETLTKYMNGQFDGGYINARLTTSTTSLFDDGFYSRLKKSGEEADLKKAIQNNSVSGWKTNIPIRLYHGTKDEIIPYRNSEITLKNFKRAGSNNVTLVSLHGKSHGSGFLPMFESLVPWFLEMK